MATAARKPAATPKPTDPAYEPKTTLYAWREMSRAQQEALDALATGNVDKALMECLRGKLEIVYVLQNRFSDPEELEKLGGRGRNALLGSVQNQINQLAGAAQAGPQEESDYSEGAAVGPVDTDEG